MARAKNRGYQQSFSPSYTIRRWRLGVYIRLSKEDLKKGKDDSNSVKNQRDLLNDFYRRNIDEFESITEYVDDGHTGTDANREDFQRLLADVMSGKINCVIVKDLSRFARNYSDAGSLIDNLFVQMGVRFISLAENVDSYKNPDSVSNIIVSSLQAGAYKKTTKKMIDIGIPRELAIRLNSMLQESRNSEKMDNYDYEQWVRKSVLKIKPTLSYWEQAQLEFLGD